MPRLRNLALAAILVGVVVLPVNQPVAAALRDTSAVQSRTATSIHKPSTTRASAIATNRMVAGKPDLQREVFGFVNSINLNNWTTWNLNLLSTIAYFGIAVNSGDGNLVQSDTGWANFHSSTMSSMVTAAHAHGVRVIVSLDLHDFAYNSTGPMCQGLNPVNTPHTIQQTANLINAAGIDGVNIDYEGTLQYCFTSSTTPGVTNRDWLTQFAHDLRAAMPGKYIAIDTFSGSAEDNQEFFDITGLAPYVDSFFVMAYDMDYANASEIPLNCSSYCSNPMSPLNTYRFNVTKSASQYTALVPASKVIMGQPLYGRWGCVASSSIAHQTIANPQTTTYAFASQLIYQHGVSQAAGHRDPGDGVSEWDTWWDSDLNCIGLQYWDDVLSMGAKFDAINHYNLGGVGFFSLDYAGGAPEFWSTISTYFSCPVTINLAASQTTTQFSVPLTAGSCSVAYFEVKQYDTTISQGWLGLNPVSAANGAGAATANGYAGHSYTFMARAHSAAGVVSAWTSGTTAIASNATNQLPFNGLYTLDAYGGTHADNSGPLDSSAYWAGWSIAKAAEALPGATAPQSGFILDGFGGLHPFGAPGLAETTGTSGHYWPGSDIARDFAFLPDATGGFVLDAYGGLHPFRVNGNTSPLAAQGAPYWAGKDLARKVVIFSDGTGGYILDAWGGVHPFGINGPSPVAPATMVTTGYWAGWDIARDVVLVPGNGNHSGYVLDGFGGLHPFHPNADGSTLPATLTTAYWGGQDIARGAWLLPGSATSGYTLDLSGGLHPFGSAPALTLYPYWAGKDLAREIFGA
ncbi:MAG TPA: glycosyl hydrolase family 18 protein [Methylomirabilota bacterium]|nr:glycosyl hydrolase family 18 protein [Methylomirabilota bacterium]